MQKTRVREIVATGKYLHTLLLECGHRINMLKGQYKDIIKRQDNKDDKPLVDCPTCLRPQITEMLQEQQNVNNG